MNIDIFTQILLVTSVFLAAFNGFLFLRLKKNKKDKVDFSILDRKISLLKKEIEVLEKKDRLQEEQIIALTSSVVSFEKILSALISSSSSSFGGGFGSGDDNIH